MMTPNSGQGDPGLRHRIRDHIRALGDSPADVARHLEDHGVSGLPGRASDCAVARYLHVVIGAETTVKRVVVMERTIRVRRTGWRPTLVLRLPKATTAFVRAFDAGCYPTLMQGTTEDRTATSSGSGASSGSGLPPVGPA